MAQSWGLFSKVVAGSRPAARFPTPHLASLHAPSCRDHVLDLLAQNRDAARRVAIEAAARGNPETLLADHARPVGDALANFLDGLDPVTRLVDDSGGERHVLRQSLEGLALLVLAEVLHLDDRDVDDPVEALENLDPGRAAQGRDARSPAQRAVADVERLLRLDSLEARPDRVGGLLGRHESCVDELRFHGRIELDDGTSCVVDAAQLPIDQGDQPRDLFLHVLHVEKSAAIGTSKGPGTAALRTPPGKSFSRLHASRYPRPFGASILPTTFAAVMSS